MENPPPHEADYAFHMHELNNRFGVAISSLTFMSTRLTNDLDKRLAETALLGMQHAHDYVKELLATTHGTNPLPPTIQSHRTMMK